MVFFRCSADGEVHPCGALRQDLATGSRIQTALDARVIMRADQLVAYSALLVGFVFIKDAKCLRSDATTCSAGLFLRKDTNTCQECSKCQDNLIILKPCNLENDTFCGPFRDFTFQQRAETDDRIPLDIGDSTGIKTDDVTYHHRNSAHSPGPTSVSQDPDHWRILAMALAGVLCVVSVFLIVFVVITCYIRKRQRSLHKEPVYNSDMTEVVIYRDDTNPNESPASAARLLHKKKRRKKLVRVYHPGASLLGNNPHFSDEILETEDSSGSTCSSHLPGIALRAIPENTEYDADNSGQTASSITNGTSTDYVYFKAPYNANGP